jgi:hypothetical protein
MGGPFHTGGRDHNIFVEGKTGCWDKRPSEITSTAIGFAFCLEWNVMAALASSLVSIG